MSSGAYVRITVLSSFDYKRADVPKQISDTFRNFFHEIIDDVFEPVWKDFISKNAHDPVKYLQSSSKFNATEHYKNIIEGYVGYHGNGQNILHKIEEKFNELLQKDEYRELKKFFENPKNADLKEKVIWELKNDKLRWYIMQRAVEFSAFREHVLSFIGVDSILDKKLTANYKNFTAKLVYKTSYLIKTQDLSLETAVERAINELLLQNCLHPKIRSIINANKEKFTESMRSYISQRMFSQKSVATNFEYLYCGSNREKHDSRLLEFDEKIRKKEAKLLGRSKPKRASAAGRHRVRGSGRGNAAKTMKRSFFKNTTETAATAVTKVIDFFRVKLKLR